ncbi:MAG TPA: DGQHR domain-containing protein DpdB [Armatimonadota bacterium]|jgi:DGQHR domain-containing protein
MRFDALRISQPSGREVYAFAATAEEILRVADISRVGRGTTEELIGYQRPEVVTHIAEIRKYLDDVNAVLPNTIIVALDGREAFTPEHVNGSVSRGGILDIPETGDGQVPCGFVVDGQQRLAAIASCAHGDFPVFVTAFHSPDVADQRKQFVLVNRTKPLPSGLIYELLPEVDGHLPSALAKQHIAATLTARLNRDPSSPLYQRIKTPTCAVGIIKDNSVRRMVFNSLSDGALFALQDNHLPRDATMDCMVELVSVFWEGVRLAFPEAWDLPPKSSRLTHGVGIVALGYVMDHLHAKRRLDTAWNPPFVAQALDGLRPHCAWTSGRWRFAAGEERLWNELQNTDRDVRILTHHFRRQLEGNHNDWQIPDPALAEE